MNEPSLQFDAGDPAEVVLPSAAKAAAVRRPRDPLTRQKAVVALGRRALAPPDLLVLVQDAAALLAEMLDAECCGVAEPSADGQSLGLRVIFTAAESEEPRVLLNKSDSQGDRSLAGYVLEAAHPVIVADLGQEKRFTDHFLLGCQLRSAIAVPLKLPDCSFGSLAAYSRQPDYFGEEDLLFLETIAHLLVTTIARTRAEESRALDRRVSDEVLDTVEALVLMLDPQWQIVQVNAACRRTTGFSLEEVRGRPLWSVFAGPKEAETFRAAARKYSEEVTMRRRRGAADRGAPPPGFADVDHEGELLTKHAQQRRVAWSFGAVCDAQGKPQSLIATGIDITAQREAEETARLAEQAAAEARQPVPPANAGDDAEPDTLLPEGPAFSRLPTPSNAERRRRPRRSYPYYQQIGYIVQGRLPARDTFTEVQCSDIAAGGFSFLSPVPPQSDSLVVALGVPPKFTYLTAQVAHVTRTTQNGRRFFLVGCNYAGRATY
jgi:PAS domain-containing protein